MTNDLLTIDDVVVPWFTLRKLRFNAVLSLAAVFVAAFPLFVQLPSWFYVLCTVFIKSLWQYLDNINGAQCRMAGAVD